MVQRREIALLVMLIFSICLWQNPNFDSTKCNSNNLDDHSTSLLSSDLILLNSHAVQIDIPSSETVFVTEIYNIENRFSYPVDNLHLWLNHTCSNITVQDGSGDLDFSVITQTTFFCQISLDLRQSLDSNESTVFYIYYNLDMMPLFEDVSKYYYFEYSSCVNFQTTNHYLSIKLPENSYIHEEAGITSIYPTNCTQNVAGKRLIFSWNLRNLLPLANPIFIVRYDPPSIETAHLPIWAFIVGPLAGISIGVISTYFLMRRREGKSIKDMGVMFLNESQKVLLRIVKESGGKIAQSDLGRKADYTRAKTSRNLLLLEEQGLVRKEKWGRNALVYLTKAGEKVIE